MKRSEALREIRNALTDYEHRYLDYNERAELILSSLEKAGMLPPKPTDRFRREGKKLIYQMYHKWEPE